MTDRVKKAVANAECDLVVIPGGMSMLQPIDVSLNRPFKDRVKRLFHEWTKQEDKTKTLTGCVKRPSLSTVAKWVNDAWYDLPDDMVHDAFVKCSISTRTA